jgi:hypothetical protein
MVVYNIRLGYDGSPNGIHGVGGVLDIPPPGCSPPCGAKGWLPGNRVRPVSWEYDPCDYAGIRGDVPGDANAAQRSLV